MSPRSDRYSHAEVTCVTPKCRVKCASSSLDERASPTSRRCSKDRAEERARPRGDEGIDGRERRLHAGARLLRVQQPRVDHVEEARIECQRLDDDLAIDQPARAQHLDLRERRRRVQNPQRGVIEIAARDEPLVGLVDRADRLGCRPEELHLDVACADVAQALAQRRNRVVVRVEQPSLGEQRVDEGIVRRALDHLPELAARDHEHVDVDAVGPGLGMKRSVRRLDLPIVDGHEPEIDVRLLPHHVVREAAAEDRRENRLIGLDLFDQAVERGGERRLECSAVRRRSAWGVVAHRVPYRGLRAMRLVSAAVSACHECSVTSTDPKVSTSPCASSTRA